MTNRQACLLHVGVLVGFSVVAVCFAWPLPLHLGTHLSGPPGGDTGVYVWNQWVFQHELLNEHRLPYATSVIFGASRPANLSLHNYTLFQNIVALPLMPLLGVVATFNTVYLLMTVITAYTTFLFVRRVTGRAAEACIAGLLFAWSPVLVTRSMDHFSLVAAAPLPLFALFLLRATDTPRIGTGIALGATLWWAFSTDVYYAVYCVLIAAVVLTAHLVQLERRDDSTYVQRWRRIIDVHLVSAGVVVATVLVSGGHTISVLGVQIRAHSLYNPMLVVTVLALLRFAIGRRVSLRLAIAPEPWQAVRCALAAGVTASLLLSPVLYALAIRFIQSDLDTGEIFWRSSPRGVDVLAFLLPNPNHPLALEGPTAFLRGLPMGYIENVASIPMVAIGVTVAARWAGWRPPRRWIVLTGAFTLLALGPFIHIAGLQTYVPGPWAILRYVPVIGLARSPTRFAVVVVLGCTVLFGIALAWLGREYPLRRRLLLTTVAFVLIAELIPAPRRMYSAITPPMYRHVAAAPQGVSLLELPFGVRDGKSSIGDFSAQTQFFQTSHGKTVWGGYLSRVSNRRINEVRSDPVLDALATLSDNGTLSLLQEHTLSEFGPMLMADKRIGFVVIDRSRASDELQRLAISAFRLELVESDYPLEIYAPRR